MSEECSEDYYGPQRDSIYIVIPLTVVYVIMFITGTIGNVSTCVVIARNKSMHTATNYYLFSLAISDLVLLLAGLPQEIYLFWWRYPYIFGGVFCFLRGLLAETSSNATVLTITAFTVERYLAICHPFLSHTMSKLSRVVKLILLIWILSVGLAIPQALPLRVIGDCPQCVIVDTIIEHAFELSTFLFFVAPMTLIIVLYVLIGMRLKSSRMMKKRISTNARIQSKSSRKVVKMLAHDINLESFNKLAQYPEFIKEVIPSVGKRMKWWQKYNIYTKELGELFRVASPKSASVTTSSLSVDLDLLTTVSEDLASPPKKKVSRR